MPTPALSRRRLLSAAAVSAAASPLAAIAREAAAADLNLGIQLYSLRGYKAEEAMKHARDIGFRFVEFYGDMFPVNSDAAAIAALANSNTFRLAAASPPKPLTPWALIVSPRSATFFFMAAIAAAWELVTGKPPSERVVIALSYVGLLLILSLMVWVFGLDLGLVSRLAPAK